MKEKRELVIFETNDSAVKLEVPVENETVWLTQAQMVKGIKPNITILTSSSLSDIVLNPSEVLNSGNGRIPFSNSTYYRDMP